MRNTQEVNRNRRGMRARHVIMSRRPGKDLAARSFRGMTFENRAMSQTSLMSLPGPGPL